MIERSRGMAFLDYFRIPSSPTDRVELVEALSPRHPLKAGGQLQWRRQESPARCLLWPGADRLAADGAPFAAQSVNGVTVCARVVPDRLAAEWLANLSGGWRKVALRASGEVSAASVWADDGGNLFLPFDPDEAMLSLWSERYRAALASGLARRAKRAAVSSYYRIRPALPRRTQLWLQRRGRQLQERAQFPGWPAEDALHDLYALLFGVLSRLTGEAVPFLSLWPNGATWAFVLTHDVETANGYGHLHLLREIEEELGYRSAWYFVPKRYEVEPDVVRDLTSAGFEVGVHGLYHDGRDLESRSMLEARLPEIVSYKERWDAVGFRSPALRRAWDLMPLLPFDYDSSYPDTDPFGPDAGGCCSILPYSIGGLVELPLTLPHDHGLFGILHETTEATWLEKTRHVRGRGGMALLLTHPDYMLDPALRAAYRRYLEAFAEDASAWRPLPRDVAEWWRRRAASRLERVGGEWRIVGPAARDGSVVSADA